MSPKPLTLHTIGHSNHAEKTFIDLLRMHGITVLVDTRSSPYSKFAPQFNQESLRAAAREAGIEYLFLGKELGGRPQGLEYYDPEGHVLYGKVAESGPFASGLARVLDLAGSERVALACSEENPSHCHRRLLIARVLAERGVEVLHIRGDGQVESERDLRVREEAEKAPGGARKRGSPFRPEAGPTSRHNPPGSLLEGSSADCQVHLSGDLRGGSSARGNPEVRDCGGDHVTPDRERIDRVPDRLSAGVPAIIAVGLTRPFAASLDQDPMHWLQVNNIQLQDDPVWRLSSG